MHMISEKQRGYLVEEVREIKKDRDYRKESQRERKIIKTNYKKMEGAGDGMMKRNRVEKNE